MQMSFTTSPPNVAVVLMVGLMTGLSVDISAAVTVDICSEGTIHVTGRFVNISSPGYPSKHGIRENIICSCHVTTGQNSRSDIQIQPQYINFTSSNAACYASIELWNSSERVDKKFCLNAPRKNFSNSVEFKSVYLTNITYQAFRPRSLNYEGTFLLSVTATRATNLLLMCTSFSSTSTQVISSRPTYPISSIVRSSSTTSISSTIRRSSTSTTKRPTIPISSKIPISSTTPFIATTIPIRSTTPIISTTIPIRSTTPIISTTIPLPSTTPIISTINHISSTTPIIRTIVSIGSTTSTSTALQSSSSSNLNNSTETTDSTNTNSAKVSTMDSMDSSTLNSVANSTLNSVASSTLDTMASSTLDAMASSTLDTMASSTNSQVDAWSSTEDFTALGHSYNDNLLWILIGVLLPIALIAMIATTVIACRVRKLKRHSVRGIIAGHLWGQNDVCSLYALINNSYEMRSRRQEECTADPSSTVAVSQKGSASTPRKQNEQTKSQTANYTPMNQNSPKTFGKTGLSASVYADIEEIESQRQAIIRGNAASSPPVRGAETRDNVYYNTATDAASAQLGRNSQINGYETCYSPEIDGVTSLTGLNSAACGVYASIDECATDVSKLPTGSQQATVHDQDDALYCNVGGKRGSGAGSRKTSGAEVTLVDNQLYSS